MPDLIAQGSRHTQRWRRPLRPGIWYSVGRTDADWNVPWDTKVSRSHAQVLWNGRRLEVAKNPNATNPVFHQGQPVESCLIEPEDFFVVGDTTFTLTTDLPDVSLDVPIPATEQTFSAQYLRESTFQDAEKQIEALSQIPDLLTGAVDDQELLVNVVRLLMRGLPRATAIAITQSEPMLDEQDSEEHAQVELLHWDSSKLSAIDFRPSERLIRHAISTEQAVVHAWSRSRKNDANFTQNHGLDWAFCTPIQADSRKGWSIYVSGQTHNPTDAATTDPDELKDDLKFVEIVASTIASLCDLRSLQEQRNALSRFFSPSVMQAIAKGNADEALAPRQTNVSVMFCDLRGFSSESEKLSEDLEALLHEVSQKLGIATRNILKEAGVIGDFHGDCAMGFWGWPIEGANSADQAIAAAIATRDEFKDSYPASQEFQMSIGIATGNAVVGRIGTSDQEKVTALGPVVNIASRLENLNRSFNTAILCDAATLRGSTFQSTRRCLGKVRPYGMATVLQIFQIVPDWLNLSDAYLSSFDEFIQSFAAGEWVEAKRRLVVLDAHPEARDDGPLQLFQNFFEQYSIAPAGWNGTLDFQSRFGL